MRVIRFFLLLSVIVILVYYWKVVYPKKTAEQAPVTVIEEVDSSPAEQMQSFSLSGFSEDGRKEWEVEGQSADILAEVINLSDIDAKVYGEDITATITSDEGIFYRKSNDVQLEKNVVAVTDEGTTLKTERLNWNSQKELLDTDEYVWIERADVNIEGVGASALPNLKRAELDKDVKVTLKEKPAVITCDGPLDVDYEMNIAYFYNNVKLDDGEVEIDSDKAVSHFDPESRALKKVVCTGNVKVIRGENETYAEELTYLPDEGKVTLTGSPKVIIKDTEELMAGDFAKP